MTDLTKTTENFRCQLCDAPLDPEGDCDANCQLPPSTPRDTRDYGAPYDDECDEAPRKPTLNETAMRVAGYANMTTAKRAFNRSGLVIVTGFVAYVPREDNGRIAVVIVNPSSEEMMTSLHDSQFLVFGIINQEGA